MENQSDQMKEWVAGQIASGLEGLKGSLKDKIDGLA
jgi:hypothetical protein